MDFLNFMTDYLIGVIIFFVVIGIILGVAFIWHDIKEFKKLPEEERKNYKEELMKEEYKRKYKKKVEKRWKHRGRLVNIPGTKSYIWLDD